MAGQSDALLFMVFARATEQRMSDFIAQQLANTAWAFAKVGQSDTKLFMAFGRAAKQCSAISAHRASPTQHGRLQPHANQMHLCFWH